MKSDNARTLRNNFLAIKDDKFNAAYAKHIVGFIKRMSGQSEQAIIVNLLLDGASMTDSRYASYVQAAKDDWKNKSTN